MPRKGFRYKPGAEKKKKKKKNSNMQAASEGDLLGDWELFGSILCGVRMSVKGSNRIEYTACGSSTPMSPPSLESVGSGGLRRPRRSVRVSLEVGGGVGGGGGFFACLFRGWTRSESAGPAAGLRGSGSDRVSVHVGSYYSTPDDSNELSVVPVVKVQVPVSGPSSSERAAVLGAMWDQSRGLWTPAAPSTVVRLGTGMESTMPLRCGLHRVFLVCLRLAAAMARPRHAVSTVMRSLKGGSAVLRSSVPMALVGTDASSTIVINASFETGEVAVVGKREGCRAVRSIRPCSTDIRLRSDGQGWDPAPGISTVPYGTLELALFSLTQGCLDVLRLRE